MENKKNIERFVAKTTGMGVGAANRKVRREGEEEPQEHNVCAKQKRCCGKIGAQRPLSEGEEKGIPPAIWKAPSPRIAGHPWAHETTFRKKDHPCSAEK